MHKDISHVIEEHKKKVSGPHFLFSSENPSFLEKSELNLTHEQILHHLKGAGHDAHSVDGYHGHPGKAILIFDSADSNKELHSLVSRLGHATSIHSDGKNHEMHIHHGENAGHIAKGSGIEHHSSKNEKSTSLPGNVGHFSHSFGDQTSNGGEYIEEMQKGALKNAGIALGMAGALATASPVHSEHGKSHSPYSTKKMLHTIAQVESSNGKQQNHKELGGMHHGEHAFGKYGMTPHVIRDTIKMHKDLKDKHQKVANLRGENFHRYMKDNPELEDKVAERHLKRLEHHFGGDPVKLSHAWLNGISGTNKAIKEKKDLSHHWHVIKAKKAYSKES